METILSSIIKELKLDETQITNVYNYGSWVYGTNHEKSDRDFLIVMRFPAATRPKRLKFQRDFDYFHRFDLRRLKNCDVTIHSCENFELLLEKNYMLAVECMFYPEEFILKNQIDYKTIYLSKYYNPLRLRQVVFYENRDAFQHVVDTDDGHPQQIQSNSTIDQFLCDAVHTTTLEEDRLLKYLFHGLRYLDIGEQLIRTRSINNFKRISHALFEMKHLYLNNDKDLDLVVHYFKEKTEEYQILMNVSIPTNIIQDTFQVQITIDLRHQEEFLRLCQMNNIPTSSIRFENDFCLKRCTALLERFGSHPLIVKEMKNFVQMLSKDIDIVRFKIETSLSNVGVPETDFDKYLFWNELFNYFEFRYRIPVQLMISSEALSPLLRKKTHCFSGTSESVSADGNYSITTQKFFQMGRANALKKNNDIRQYLMNTKEWSSLEVEQKFVIYDSNVHFDPNQSQIVTSQPTTTTNGTSIPQKYRIGFKNRKFFSRSSN